MSYIVLPTHTVPRHSFFPPRLTVYVHLLPGHKVWALAHVTFSKYSLSTKLEVAEISSDFHGTCHFLESKQIENELSSQVSPTIIILDHSIIPVKIWQEARTNAEKWYFIFYGNYGISEFENTQMTHWLKISQNRDSATELRMSIFKWTRDSIFGRMRAAPPENEEGTVEHCRLVLSASEHAFRYL
jgi:hypothetical protein